MAHMAHETVFLKVNLEVRFGFQKIRIVGFRVPLQMILLNLPI